MKAKVKTWLRNIENGKIKNYTEQILNEIKNNTKKGFYGLFEKDGISTYELRNTTGISHQTLTSALSNLYDEGLIQSTNQIGPPVAAPSHTPQLIQLFSGPQPAPLAFAKELAGILDTWTKTWVVSGLIPASPPIPFSGPLS